MRKPVIAALLLASAASSFALAQSRRNVAPAAAAGRPTYGTFGVDIAGRDDAVLPGDDFFDYANGGWYQRTQIPADKPGYGMFNVLDDLSRERTRGILEAAMRRPGDKVGDFYSSFIDQAAVDTAGLAPVQPWLDRIGAARSKDQLVAVMADLQRQGVGGIANAYVGQDDKAPETYAVGFSQAGLGLPDRDYYLKEDPKLAEIRTRYQAYLAQTLGLAGQTDGTSRAVAVFNLEKAIATAHWTRIESRDADRTYNRWTPAQFASQAPGFPWAVI